MSDRPPSAEEIALAPAAEADTDSWWGRYEARLVAGKMTPVARQVVEADSRYIVDSGIFGAGPPGSATWPSSRARSGLVMGAVQSGKTASMLGVASLAIDAGIDILVVLAGTRISLWRQTYERLLDQLDGYTPTDDFARGRARILVPTPGIMSDPVTPSPHEMYQLSGAHAERFIRRGRPIVMIVMKQVHHLRAAARSLHDSVYPRIVQFDQPVHLVVLDDEADDGSILDALVEQDLDPAADAFKQIPRHIVDLWATRDHPDQTATANLHATYVAYTATPQANLLQADHNPLAPRDFLSVLRTPFDLGEQHPRATTFREPRGYRSYYTGGEVFYRRIVGTGGLVVPRPPTDAASDDDERDEADERRRWVGEAMRCYLVGGAVRLWQSGQRLSGLDSQRFESPGAAKDAGPSPHSMLFHPSAGVEDHFEGAAEILEWAGALAPGDGRALIDAGHRTLPMDAVKRQIHDDESQWSIWLERFAETAAAIAHEFSVANPTAVPSLDDWPAIRDLLITEITPNVRVAVINSAPDADDRPEFEPQITGDGTWRPARDLCTVFVSGNVMARGLTLEGLTTTLFLRRANDPLADIQMQMQRWFGYRGPYLELCRVFVPSDQLALFSQYHENDEALRIQIIAAMNDSAEVAPAPTVIEGERFRATGKIAGISKTPLCPRSQPFVQLVNDHSESDPNLRVLNNAFRAASSDVVVDGKPRGRILDDPLSLTQAAELLEQLTYGDYTPDLTDQLSTRWTAVAAQIGVPGPLFKPPRNDTASPRTIAPYRCPYTVAAYLRLWHECLNRHARGLFPTDNGEVPWARLKLADKRRTQPTFHVAIRYGEGDPIPPGTVPLLDAVDFTIRPMRRSVEDGNVTSTWGSQGTGAGLPDSLFDYNRPDVPHPTEVEGRPGWRPVGEPGLILLHPIRPPGSSRLMVAVGIAIPLGGPDHFAARPDQR